MFRVVYGSSWLSEVVYGYIGLSGGVKGCPELCNLLSLKTMDVLPLVLLLKFGYFQKPVGYLFVALGPKQGGLKLKCSGTDEYFNKKE